MVSPRATHGLRSLAANCKEKTFGFSRCKETFRNYVMLRMRMPVSTGLMLLPLFAVTVQLRPRAFAL